MFEKFAADGSGMKVFGISKIADNPLFTMQQVIGAYYPERPKVCDLDGRPLLEKVAIVVIDNNVSNFLPSNLAMTSPSTAQEMAKMVSIECSIDRVTEPTKVNLCLPSKFVDYVRDRTAAYLSSYFVDGKSHSSVEDLVALVEHLFSAGIKGIVSVEMGNYRLHAQDVLGYACRVISTSVPRVVLSGDAPAVSQKENPSSLIIN